jgi:hypothetical protein
MSCEHFLEIPPFDDEISSARITMNLDQWKRKKVNCDRCLCGSADQLRRITIKPSIRLLAECLGAGNPDAWNSNQIASKYKPSTQISKAS